MWIHPGRLSSRVCEMSHSIMAWLRVHNSTSVGLEISQRMTTVSQQEALVS